MQLIKLAHSPRFELTLEDAMVETAALFQPGRWDSISWSNCVDYSSGIVMLSRELGSQDCVHTAYSMNWTTEVYDADILDFRDCSPDQHREIFSSVFEWNKCNLKRLGLEKKLYPMVNVLNPQLASGQYLCSPYQSKFVAHYLAADHALQGPAESWIVPLMPPGAMVTPITEAVYFAWTFSPQIAQRKTLANLCL